ncbi:MAG: peptidyl-prolyl cis-trans isomerase [Planctomycetes bacterium]|nr:peptidyl-prolyl cis-trans isomerase [Planctomycetota bacterium]
MVNRQYQVKSCLALMILLLGSIGCSEGSDFGSSVRIVSLAEFSSAEQASERQQVKARTSQETIAPKADTLGYVEPTTPDPEQPASSSPKSPTAGSKVTKASPESDENFQERPALRLEKPGDRIVVDSFVGQVNGRPIYADDFLSYLEDHLIEVAAKKTGQARIKEFEEIISLRLGRVVKNELILADAESSLSEQQQLGLLAFLKNREEEFDRQTSSSGRYAAEDRVHNESGAESLERHFNLDRDQILLYQLQRQKIEPRVIVSWRDIEQAYKARYDEFNPPARVTLSKIRLNNENEAQKIQQVKKRLEAGDDFTDIAHDLKELKDGDWDTFEMGEGGIAEIAVGDLYKEKLKGLGQGDTTDPIEFETTTMWLHVKKVLRPKGRSLYDHDVQQEIADSLQTFRTDAETEKYIRSLFEDGIFDELDDMRRRLVSIALQRYAK